MSRKQVLCVCLQPPVHTPNTDRGCSVEKSWSHQMFFTFCPLVLCRNSVVAVGLAVNKEMDTFHPHKQSRLYGITTALSQCPPGNSPALLLSG